MRGLRHLSFEAGRGCTKAAEHEWCPTSSIQRTGAPLTPDEVAGCVREALTLGFDGYVGFHYYNEPTLYRTFIDAVMDAVPEAHYMLWTNGAKLTEGWAQRFEWVVVTDYGDAPRIKHPRIDYLRPTPDERLHTYEDGPTREGPCQRVAVELAIDNGGTGHICCQDWQGSVDIGNIRDGFADVVNAWRTWRDRILAGDCPDVCRTCRGAQ